MASLSEQITREAVRLLMDTDECSECGRPVKQAAAAIRQHALDCDELREEARERIDIDANFSERAGMARRS